jgi:hypothetical protein
MRRPTHQQLFRRLAPGMWIASLGLAALVRSSRSDSALRRHTHSLHRRVRLLTRRMAPIRKEPDSPEPSTRFLQPRANLSPSPRKDSAQRRSVALDDRAVGRGIRQDHNVANGLCPPAPLPPDKLGYQAHTAILLREKILDVEKRRFCLDQEKRTFIRSPGEEIDRTALAVHIERVLGQQLPVAAPKGSRHGLHQFRVRLVHQPRKIASAPSGCEREMNFEDGGRLSHARQAHIAQLASLDARNDRLIQPSAHRDIDLPPSQASTHNPEDCAHAEIVHQAQSISPAGISGPYR